MRIKSALIIYKLLKGKIKLKHIKDEISRHYTIAKISLLFVAIPLSIIIFLLAFVNVILFDVLLVGIIFYFVSCFIPDIIYVSFNVIKRKTVFFYNKKDISHSILCLLAYSFLVFSITYFVLGIEKSLVISMLAFIGVSIHLTIDKIEKLIDFLKKLLELLSSFSAKETTN